MTQKIIRICHFAASPGLGRGEVNVDLANEQSRRDDVRVSLLIPNDALFRERVAPGVEVIEYRGGRSRRNPLFLFEVAKKLRGWRPDIVHTHWAKAASAYKTIRNWVPAKWVGTKHNPRRGPIFEKIPHVIAVSRGVAESMKRRDAKIIYNGIVTERKTERARRTRPAGAAISCLAVGRLDPIKGFDRLITALASYASPWNLQIAGEGSERANLEALIQQLGVADKVQLLGLRNDVPELMAACDVFIQSSHSEGCSVALLESMHYAPLTIATPVGVVTEIFPEWLIWRPDEPGALGKMLANYDELAGRFGPWVSGQLPKFDLRATAAQHIDFYREILDRA
jgi:glycosyltransferase involved in cell wall biosynthesis